MTLRINCRGLERAKNRDRKRFKKKYGMREDGRSVKLLAKIIEKKANEQRTNLEELPTNV